MIISNAAIHTPPSLRLWNKDFGGEVNCSKIKKIYCCQLSIVTYEKADKKIRDAYDAIQSKFEMVPNIFKAMANNLVVQ